MVRPEPKFKVGQTVQDTLSGRLKTITVAQYQAIDGIAQWYYSFDSLGWYFYPENELEAV